MAKFQGINLIAITFFHGVLASGFMPILNTHLGSRAGLAFTSFFIGIFIGQLSIYFFKILSKEKWSYPVYEILYSFSILLMAMSLNEIGLLSGRFMSGICTGLALPPLFSILSNLHGFLDLGKRVALFNSAFSLGFVLGTPLIEHLIKHQSASSILFTLGLLVLTLSVLMLIFPIPVKPSKDVPKVRDLLKIENLSEKFIGLFIAKVYYGFLLGSITSYQQLYFSNYSMGQIMIFVSIVFIASQVVTEKISHFYPLEHLKNLTPLIISGLIILFFNTSHWIGLILLASFFHGALLFAGIKQLGTMPSGARGFAIYSALTDLGMILGSSMGLDPIKGQYLFFILATTPLLSYILTDHSKVRAERFFPFVGPITLYKVLSRQKNPLKTVVDTDLTHLTFEEKNNVTPNEIKLLFFGDLCPSTIPFQFSKEVKELIACHDLAYFNLEGTQTTQHYTPQNKKLLFDIPDTHMKALFNDIPNTVFSIVNNHIFDRGVHAYQETLNRYPYQKLITSNGHIRTVNKFKIAEVSIGYGANIPWRKHSAAFFIKPDQIIDQKNKKTLMLKNKIQVLKDQSDFLILSYHWGFECEFFPSSLQQECASVLEEMGVDLLYGHHAHLAQGYEWNSKSLKLYCLGNFISDMHLIEYQQGVAYSIGIHNSHNIHNNCLKKAKIVSVKPYFHQMNKTSSTIDLIKPEESLSYQLYQLHQ